MICNIRTQSVPANGEAAKAKCRTLTGSLELLSLHPPNTPFARWLIRLVAIPGPELSGIPGTSENRPFTHTLFLYIKKKSKLMR
ncbi:unnamed protein product [Timema podura]|uniref:Uncharacterized protein n=1 Tax=Timema podura TaxID=61482 RepID=A0ABN7P822_TIMPD|nr:unnamed protein product [Timema podura]